MIPAPATPGRRLRRPALFDVVCVALPVSLAVAVRLPALHQPLDRDSAAYATLGSELWSGRLPYKDLFDHKQPLTYPVYAAIDLFGARTASVRVAAMLAAGLAAVAVAFLARPLLGQARALLAAGVVAVVSAVPIVQGFDLNTEHILVPLAAATVLGSLRFRQHRWAAAGAGLLFGLCVLAKIVAVFLAPAVLVPLLCLPGEWRERLRRLATFSVAAAVPVLAVVVVYLLAGDLGSLVEANVTYNRTYVAATSPELSRFVTMDPDVVAGLAAIGWAVGLVRLAASSQDRPGVAALLLWLTAAWVGAKFGGRDYPHYFATVITPAVLLPFLHPLAARRLIPAASLALGAAPLVVLGYGLQTVPGEVSRMFDRGPEEIAFVIYGEQSLVWAEYEPVGRLIADRAAPGDDMFVAGPEPGFYWYSGQPVAGRYSYDYPLYLDPAREAEFRTSFCRRPPTRILVPFEGGWPPYLAMVDRAAYPLEFRSGDIHVFHLGQPKACLP